MDTMIDQAPAPAGAASAGDVEVDLLVAPLTEEQGASVSDAGATLPPLDDDAIEDLAAAGIVLDDEAQLAQAQRDAAAAYLLRRAGKCEAEIDRLKQAMIAEMQMIGAHYERQIKTLATEHAGYVAYVQHLAEISFAVKGFGKKKSAATPYGTYGYTEKSATAKLVDEAKLVAWAREERPDAVRVKATLPLADALQFFTEEELAAQKVEVLWGEIKKHLWEMPALPPGVESVPPSREFYAKPDVAVIAAGGVR